MWPRNQRRVMGPPRRIKLKNSQIKKRKRRNQRKPKMKRTRHRRKMICLMTRTICSDCIRVL